ncbi:MAG: EAL domain-containing protein [Anaerolineales bacterium]|nr:EAL domain-containing protein [Anaerolineales bacterium]
MDILSPEQENAAAKAADDALDQAMMRVMLSGPLGMLVSRIRDDVIVTANQRFLGLMEYSLEEIVGQTTIDLGMFAELDRVRRQNTRVSTDGVQDFEARLKTRNGEHRNVLTGLMTIDLDGEPCFLRTVYDITERYHDQDRVLEEAIHGALHDPLTGLPNRSLFMGLLERSFSRQRRRPDYIYAVLFLDLDHFKEVNDRFGHLAGDEALQTIANRLESRCQPGDTVARLGGDEFAILVDDFRDASQLLRFANDLQKVVNDPIILDGTAVGLSTSVGIALSTANYSDPQAILNDADKAMYRAKAHGRARHEVYDRELHARAMAQLKLRSDLEWAVGHSGFSVHYQPIISLETGQVVQFEALGRWRHPDQGLLTAADFIQMAEETGLIIDLGRWMLQEACSDLQRWGQGGSSTPDLGISLNLSHKEFIQPDLIRWIENTLKRSDIDPELLSLEIREGIVMSDPDACGKILSDLRSLGVKIYIDDFGTGHSSLSFMYSFPIDALKIARSFTARIGPQGENSEIVRTIVLLARDFGLDAIAEGVETEEQLAQLRELNCRYAQGFYFSKPLEGKDSLALLRKKPQW